MRISQVTYPQYSQNTNCKNKKSNAAKPSFQSNNLINSYLAQKARTLHHGKIMLTSPSQIEQYFAKEGIPASFREGSVIAQRTVAYCTYQANEIFKQLKFTRPTHVGLMDFRRIGDPNIRNATGITNQVPLQLQSESYPLRAVLFNTFGDNKFAYTANNKNYHYCWEDYFEITEEGARQHQLSTGHFLGQFIHEYAHNHHYHQIYSTYGAPCASNQYMYNPNSVNILATMSMDLETNPQIPKALVAEIRENLSKYAAQNLFEAYAEAMTQDIINSLDLFTLRLVKNPFATQNKTSIITQIINKICSIQ